MLEHRREERRRKGDEGGRAIRRPERRLSIRRRPSTRAQHPLSTPLSHTSPHTHLPIIFRRFTHGVLHSIRFQWLQAQALLPDSTGGTFSPHYWVFWQGSLRCGPPLGCSPYPCLPCLPVTYSTWHVHQSVLFLGLPSISPQEQPPLSPSHSRMRAPFPAPRWRPREGTVRCP